MACPGEATVDTSDDPPMLTIASDCSGMETPALVLREMGIPFRSLWASEIDEHCRSFIRNMSHTRNHVINTLTMIR